ncbi:MAG: right-handed parallel beta-helix repeat-containing protein [Bacteroidales bacterium]|nr:right-handed parallel beta-helix repeat-containing protein [Bacteroidales bacterium]
MKNIYRFLGFIMISWIVSLTVNAQPVEKSDTIWSNEIWSADTVKVTDNIVIVDDVTLTINPGTRVEFQGPHHMVILGTINAVGTESDTIVFTAADTTGFSDFESTDGSWNGMIFYNGMGYGGANGAMDDNDTSRLSHCRIEFTKAIPTAELVWSAIEVGQFSRLVISNCEIRNNYTFSSGGAIRLYSSSDFAILDNYIHHNVAVEQGGGIFSSQSAPVIKGNTITYNRTTSMDPASGHGGGIGIWGMNPLISNNIIQHNQAIYGAGIFLSNSFGIVENNTIAYNTGYDQLPDLRSIGGGIYMEQTSSPRIRSNLVSNNYAIEGGGIYFINSQPDIINNLIVNNTGTDAGGSLYGWDSEANVINNTIARNVSVYGGGMNLTNTRMEFINNIFWENGEIHLQDKFAILEANSSIIQGGATIIAGVGTYHFTSLIEDDPGFISKSLGNGKDYDGLVNTDWSVTGVSPCVNAGLQDLGDIPVPKNDLMGNKRIEHNIIDIGAYELHVPVMYFHDTIKADTTWIADTVRVDGDITVNDDVTLTILPGTYVEFQVPFKIQVNGTLIARGNQDKMITFTVADTIGFHDPSISDGGWGGITFDNSYDGMNNDMADNDSSVFRFCHFSLAKAIEPDPWGGALSLKYYSKVTVSDCVFENNSAQSGGGAIYLNRSDMVILNCQFYNNVAGGQGGGAIFTEREVEITLRHNTFENNFSTWRGGAINLYSSKAIIDQNIFTNNNALNRGGAIYLRQTPGIISGNLLSNNYSGNFGGGMCLQEKNCQLINNLIINNSANGAGGGIYLLYIDDALTSNNTVCNNYAQTGGGTYNAFTNHRSYNDILYGNDCASYGKQYGLYSVQVSLEFSNSNIEGGPGEIGIFTGQKLPGTFTNMIDSLPEFISPSDGPGNIYDGTIANWNLKSISPCINAGTLDGLAGIAVNLDFVGNPRIFADIVDVGAYESQYGLPVITKQPFNQVTCSNDSVSFIVKTEFESFFQWQKDEEDIPGATNSTYMINPVSAEDAGNYQCMVSNAFGTIASIPVYMVASAAPEITLQPQTTWGVEEKRTILSTAATGTPPIHYQWFKDGDLLPLKKYPDLWINNTSAGSEGVFHCIIANVCGEVSTDSVQLYLAPQLCMVTVDSTTGKNLVIWEKKSTAPIESYNIYRESVVAGEYDLIGNVPADDLSEFTDSTADPREQAYIYRITAMDANGNESDLNLSRPHKTIHLLTSIKPEDQTIQCEWDHYYGFDYGTMFIYRGITGTTMGLVKSISSSLFSWTDLNAEPGQDYYYRIMVESPAPCNPTGGKKAGSGPYSHSLSNQDDNRLQVTSIEDAKTESSIVVFPNPFSDHTTLRFPNPEHSEYTLLVRDISGKLVRNQGKITGEEIILSRDNLKAGYYFVEIRGLETFRGKVVIE